MKSGIILQKIRFAFIIAERCNMETWPSGRRRALGERLSSNATRVRISTSPP